MRFLLVIDLYICLILNCVKLSRFPEKILIFAPHFFKAGFLNIFYMKRILLTFCFLLSLLSLCAQSYDRNCFYGITFEVSTNPNWGFGELVITSVEPHSPAEKAGIKVGDIIMEINGVATYLRDNQRISELLFGNYNPTIKFTIRNMNTYFKEYELDRKCLYYNSLSEKQLSEMFAFYSLENTNVQRFILPAKINPTDSIDYADYHTYDFYIGDKKTPAIDAQITQLIAKELEARGLVRNTKDPDIIVQSYYSLQPNRSFTGLNADFTYDPQTLRYDVAKEKMVPMAIYPIDDVKAKNTAQYTVSFGFTFYDKKYIEPGKVTQIWDCLVSDYLSEKCSLEEYVRIHTPLLLLQFPFGESKVNPEYTLTKNRYNYTGMYLDANDLKTITDVDNDSPAYKAGLRSGYVIKKIDNIPFDFDKKSLMSSYEDFIWKTTSYRDRTSLTKLSGDGDNNLPWNRIYLRSIQDAFTNKKNKTAFAYLYKFEDYINCGNENTLYIEAWDGYQQRRFRVTPEVRESLVVKAL